ncbi:dihydropteroate synthase [[Clostridium] polysaccharolyticum]
MIIGKERFSLKHTHVMGILNVTPDSFSDGGSWNQKDKALQHVEEMIQDGAAIVDVGGESTRPNYTKIADEEEIERVVPVIEAIKRNFDIPVSVDTYKSKVAREACKAGADLVNDIWGLKYDDEMAEIVKRYEKPVCIMHNRNNQDYASFVDEWIQDLKESIQIAKQAGIGDDKIILDPGVGFAKAYEMNLLAMKHLEKLLLLDYPVLLGTSRKSVIGLALNLPVTEREEGTLATTVMAVMKGCQFVRVHDVKANVRAIKMTEAILQAGE